MGEQTLCRRQNVYVLIYLHRSSVGIILSLKYFQWSHWRHNESVNAHTIIHDGPAAENHVNMSASALRVYLSCAQFGLEVQWWGKSDRTFSSIYSGEQWKRRISRKISEQDGLEVVGGNAWSILTHNWTKRKRRRRRRECMLE